MRAALCAAALFACAPTAARADDGTTPFVSTPVRIFTIKNVPVPVLRVDIYSTFTAAQQGGVPVKTLIYANVEPTPLETPFTDNAQNEIKGKIDLCLGGPLGDRQLPQAQTTYWYTAGDGGASVVYQQNDVPQPFDIVPLLPGSALDIHAVPRGEARGDYVRLYGPDLPYCRPYTSDSGRHGIPLFEPPTYLDHSATFWDFTRLDIAGLYSRTGGGVVPGVFVAIALTRRTYDVVPSSSTGANGQDRYNLAPPAIEPDRNLTQQERDLNNVGRGLALDVGAVYYTSGQNSGTHFAAALSYQLNSRFGIAVGATPVAGGWQMLYGVTFDPIFGR